MDILILLVPLALSLGITFLGLLAWAVRSGQLDQLDDDAFLVFQGDRAPPSGGAVPAGGAAPTDVSSATGAQG